MTIKDNPPNQPEKRIELIVLRHGETQSNRELRFQGHLDAPLNEMGFEQAKRSAKRLKEHHQTRKIKHIFCSDLTRTRQTLEPTLREIGIHATSSDLANCIHFDSAWREQHFGILEGLNIHEIQQNHAKIWENWLRCEPDFAIPNGESLRQFHARIMQALSDLTKHCLNQSTKNELANQLVNQLETQTVLLITHGGVLDLLYRLANDLPLNAPRQCAIPNTGFNYLYLDQHQKWHIDKWAEISHLADLPPQAIYEQKIIQKNG